MPSETLLAALQDDPGYRQIIDDWESASVALVGVGAPALTRHSITKSVPRDHPNLAQSVGDVCLAFYDRTGTEITFPGSNQMVRIPGDTLRRIPTRIALATGAHKAPGIVAGALAKWFNVLVTDEATARVILETGR